MGLPITQEEMNILVEKLNKGELRWKNINQEVRLIRNQATQSTVKFKNGLCRATRRTAIDEKNIIVKARILKLVRSLII